MFGRRADMRCDDCHDALSPYLDGELMPEEAQSIHDHIASCSHCASEHETLVALSGRLKHGLEGRRAPDVLKARIRSALAQPDAFKPVERQRRLPWAALIAAGLVVAGLSGGASFAVARRNASPPSIGQQV